MPMVKTRDGSSVFVRILGRGQPVMLLHGFALDSRQWLPLIAPYLNSYKFYLPDFRGHAHSPLGNFHRSLALDTLCGDLQDIIEAFQIDRLMLGAYSMGALVGLEFCLRDSGQHVQQYLHIEASPRFHSSADWNYGFNPVMKERAIQLVELWNCEASDLLSPPTMLAYRALIQEMVLQAFPQQWIKRVLAVIPERLLETLLPDPRFTHEFFSYLMQGDFDVRHRVGDLKIPGLIMSGRQSHYFPWQGADWLHQHWQQSQLLIFDHSGHGLMYSEPLKFRKAFTCFLQGELETVHERLLGRRWFGLRAAS